MGGYFWQIVKNWKGARAGSTGRPTGRSLPFSGVIHMLSTILGFTALLFSLISLLYAVHCKKTLEERNARSVSLREIAVLSEEVTNLGDAYASMLASHKKLRSRIGMREKRARDATQNGSEIPDPRDDPDGYKRAMRLKLFHKPH